MKLKLKCTQCGKHLGKDGESVVYIAKFGVVLKPGDPPHHVYGNLDIQSPNQLHYKPGLDYTIMVSELLIVH